MRTGICPGSAVPAAVNSIRAAACAASPPRRKPALGAVSSWSMSTPGMFVSHAPLGHDNDRAPGVSREPAGDRAGHVVQPAPGRAHDQRVGAAGIGGGGKFLGRVAAPGHHADLEPLPVADLVELPPAAGGPGAGPFRPALTWTL